MTDCVYDKLWGWRSILCFEFLLTRFPWIGERDGVSEAHEISFILTCGYLVILGGV